MFVDFRKFRVFFIANVQTIELISVMFKPSTSKIPAELIELSWEFPAFWDRRSKFITLFQRVCTTRVVENVCNNTTA